MKNYLFEEDFILHLPPQSTEFIKSQKDFISHVLMLGKNRNLEILFATL